MKTPTEGEIIKEVESLKLEIKKYNLDNSGQTKNILNNKINKILRMLRCPVRKVTFPYHAKDGEKK